MEKNVFNINALNRSKELYQFTCSKRILIEHLCKEPWRKRPLKFEPLMISKLLIGDIFLVHTVDEKKCLLSLTASTNLYTSDH